ncbi:MAG: zinc-dependent alcohol dehydrogenase family protein [Anaerolineales bacterium]|nr:zinc-dependent alcohol dehydrogenase family protein [Anaerolineales bacterium]
MRAMRLFEPRSIVDRPLSMIDQPLPEPGPGQVRIKVNICGVCHTDLHTVEGDIHPPSLPLTPGHQVVGIIEATGSGLDAGVPASLKPGDRVGVPWLYSTDGVCEFCKRGEANLCPNARFTGFHVDGGFAEYMIAEAKYVLRLPSELSDEQAAPMLCAGIIGYRAMRKADVQPGERIGLVGFGASAHLTIQVANYWSCEVYVFTRSEEHRQHALELGAVWVGGAEDEAPVSLDRAIIFAPSGKLVPKILAKLRPAGTLAINAIHTSPIPEMKYELIYGERTLRSVANATYEDGVEFLELAAKIPIQATITKYGLEDANQALVDLKNSRISGEAVLVV